MQNEPADRIALPFGFVHPTNSPDHLHWVLLERLVACDDRNVFCDGLSDDLPVEGIVVVQRQIIEGVGCAALYGST